MTGNYNTGKSFWTAKFIGKNKKLETGYDQITNGICCCFDEENKIIYVDSEGFERALRKKSIFDDGLKKRDFFLRERCIKETIFQHFLLSIADVIIIFLPQCTYSDQKLIEKIVQKFPTKQIVIAHNLKTLQTLDDVQKEIKELHTFFRMKEQSIPEEILKKIENHQYKNKMMFAGKNLDNQQLIYHLILARDMTDAGKFYNQSAMVWIKSLISRKETRIIEIQKEFRDYFNENILKYFRFGEQQETKKVAFPDFGKPMSENGFQVYRLKLDQKMTPIQVVENFLGDVESTQCFKPDITFESGNIELNIRIAGKIKISLPNSKAFQIYKSFLHENKKDGEIYVHVEGFKKSFKFEPTKFITEDYLKDLKPMACFDHTSFGPFLIEEPLSKLADPKNQIKQPNQMRKLVGETFKDDIIQGEQRENFYEIDFNYMVINRRR